MKPGAIQHHRFHELVGHHPSSHTSRLRHHMFSHIISSQAGPSHQPKQSENPPHTDMYTGSTGIVTSCEITSANTPDGPTGVELLKDEPGTEVIADSAYGSGQVRAALAKPEAGHITTIKPIPERRNPRLGADQFTRRVPPVWRTGLVGHATSCWWR